MGFSFQGIDILPRQTCGLYTHTLFFHSYAGGISQFYDNIFGGELFTGILMNKVNIRLMF